MCVQIIFNCFVRISTKMTSFSAKDLAEAASSLLKNKGILIQNLVKRPQNINIEQINNEFHQIKGNMVRNVIKNITKYGGIRKKEEMNNKNAH